MKVAWWNARRVNGGLVKLDSTDSSLLYMQSPQEYYDHMALHDEKVTMESLGAEIDCSTRDRKQNECGESSTRSPLQSKMLFCWNTQPRLVNDIKLASRDRSRSKRTSKEPVRGRAKYPKLSICKSSMDGRHEPI